MINHPIFEKWGGCGGEGINTGLAQGGGILYLVWED